MSMSHLEKRITTVSTSVSHSLYDSGLACRTGWLEGTPPPHMHTTEVMFTHAGVIKRCSLQPVINSTKPWICGIILMFHNLLTIKHLAQDAQQI